MAWKELRRTVGEGEVEGMEPARVRERTERKSEREGPIMKEKRKERGGEEWSPTMIEYRIRDGMTAV